MNELKVEVRQTPGEIACNFDDLEEALRTQMTAYESLEITEDNIPERKADLATLRKVRTVVDDERKRVKKEFTKPLDDFERRVKKIEKILDEQIYRIHDGLNVFEQKRIAEKLAHNRELYDQNIGEYAAYLPYEIIKSDKWNNKTCSDNEIIFAINEQVMKVRGEIEAIKALGSEIEEKLLDAYRTHGNNLSAAITKNTEYLEAKRAAEERVEAERKAKEEAEKRAAEEIAEVAYVPEVSTPEADDIPFTAESWDSMNPPEYAIKVRGMENIEALKNFLEMSGMEFEEV